MEATQCTSSPDRVRLLCRSGGRIQLRHSDGHLCYSGGETMILVTDRCVRFSDILSKLSSLYNGHYVCFKYQLPGEGLDALVSVMNDEDLEQMMMEYEQLCRSEGKAAWLCIFLFPLLPLAFSLACPATMEASQIA